MGMKRLVQLRLIVELHCLLNELHEWSLDFDPETTYVLAEGPCGFGHNHMSIVVDNGTRKLSFSHGPGTNRQRDKD